MIILDKRRRDKVLNGKRVRRATPDQGGFPLSALPWKVDL